VINLVSALVPTSGLLPECSTVSLNVLVNQSYRDLQIVCSAKSHFRRLSGAPCTSQFLRNCSQCLALGDQTVFVTYRITVTTELWHSARWLRGPQPPRCQLYCVRPSVCLVPAYSWRTEGKRV